MRDLQFAWRRLTAAPLFTLFSVVTLALGIGVTTAVYSFLYATVWRESSLSDPERVLLLSQRAGYSGDYSLPEVRDLAAQQTVFDAVSAFGGLSLAVSGNGMSRLVHGEATTGDYFRVLGMHAALGRALLPSDDDDGAARVVVLSDSLWRRQFAADPDVVGATVRIAGQVHEVIGVMPAAASRWRARARPVEIWMPLRHATRDGRTPRFDTTRRDYRTLSVVVRLKAERSIDEANTELDVIAQRLDAVSRLDQKLGQTRRITAASAASRPESTTDREMSRLVLALPAIVLLIACTNLANLSLSRGVSRRHEFAVRRAMGASRWQLIRGQIIEGSLVAATGGLAGIGLARVLITYTLSTIEANLGASPSSRIDAHLEPAVLLAAIVAAVVSLLVATLVPALQLTRATVRSALASDTPAGALPRWRGRANLIALQVAASVGLFLLAALSVRGILSVKYQDSRRELDRVGLVSVPFAVQHADELAIRSRIDAILAAARQTTGIELVGATSAVSSSPRLSLFGMAVTTPEKPFIPKISEGTSSSPSVMTPEVFELLRLELRYGRNFDDRDDAASRLVAIVDESLARDVFGVADAAGRDVLVQRRVDRAGVYLRDHVVERVTIVGVVADVPDSRGRDQDNIYLPFSQQLDPDVSIVARGKSPEVASVVAALQQAVRRADPDLAVTFAGRADVAMRNQPALVLAAMTAIIFGLAVMALVLSMAGLYGVLSHVVARRTRELGLRMALGASTGRVIWLILKDGFRPVAEGACIGLGSATLIRFWIQPYFTQVKVTAVDPLAIIIGVGPLLIAASIACYLPARRASRVDPNVALREL
jgi:predicted permease